MAIAKGNRSDSILHGRINKRAGGEKSSRRDVARLPLDGAADAGLLRAVHRLAGKHGVDCGTQIAPGHRLVVARPAVVELPAIHQSPLRIKEKEGRCTGGLVTFGNILRLVETEGKTEIEPFSHLFQPIRRVIGIRRGVVAADAHNAKLFMLIVLANPGDFLLDVLHVRTVPADEHDEQGVLAMKRDERIDLLVDHVRQEKRRSRGSERKHDGFNSHGVLVGSQSFASCRPVSEYVIPYSGFTRVHVTVRAYIGYCLASLSRWQLETHVRGAKCPI